MDTMRGIKSSKIFIDEFKFEEHFNTNSTLDNKLSNQSKDSAAPLVLNTEYYNKKFYDSKSINILLSEFLRKAYYFYMDYDTLSSILHFNLFDFVKWIDRRKNQYQSYFGNKLSYIERLDLKNNFDEIVLYITSLYRYNLSHNNVVISKLVKVINIPGYYSSYKEYMIMKKYGFYSYNIPRQYNKTINIGRGLRCPYIYQFE